ncbi:MAG: membrane protein insertase YidC [bacterium]
MRDSSGQEQRAFLAIVLAMGVLLLWNVFFPPPRAPQVARAPVAAQHADSTAARAGSGERAATAPSTAPGGATEGAPAGAVASGPAPAPGALALPEGAAPPDTSVHIESERFHLTIASRGARLVEVALPRYRDSQGNEVQLLPVPGAGALATVAKTGAGAIALDAQPFRLVSDVRDRGERRLTWELTARDLVLRKTYVIPDHGSLFHVEQEIEQDRVGVTAWGLSWAGGLRVTEDVRGRGARGYFEGTVFAEGAVQRKTPTSAHKGPLEFPGRTRYVSVQSKYFLAAIVPEGDHQGPARLWEVESNHPGTTCLAGEILVDRAGELASNRAKYDVYVGPQDYAVLQSLGLGLEGAVDLGASWIRPLSRIILGLLIAVHHVVPNYGATIILFSFAINLLFFPLTYKSTKSMRQMSALKPRLDALKEKYKDDAQKLSEATMRVYKEAGVNPLAGCLPLLLQMPIFFALYAVLFRTIELRQAPFLFWIRDLSQPDVIYQLPFSLPLIGSGICLLPIIMGVTSYLQSKQTMVDPSQQSMVIMMPIMMTFIFFSMPSGLVLYWLTSNVFTLGTKYLFKPETEGVDGAAAAEISNGGGKRALKAGAKS